ncbi:barstar family protein [Collimonas pratensis]|uniref:Barstar family protein n=1 Tax=Collimonas pratensis TaxID=279113 RepID=A0A127QA28_9BURK|nr:barstar family protein [Collimonas pratensis]AMP06919.1 barstar family protein [Collimonas pratensis]
MPSASLNGEMITGWDSFHSESAKAFGFPEFYGRNMNAWIDCLSYLRDEDGMSKFRLKENEVLNIEVLHSEKLRQHAAEILEELEFCIAAINERYDDYGEKPALKLILR